MSKQRCLCYLSFALTLTGWACSPEAPATAVASLAAGLEPALKPHGSGSGSGGLKQVADAQVELKPEIGFELGTGVITKFGVSAVD